MTTERRLERDLPAILGDLGMAPYPDYIDDVLAATAQRRQRPAWTFPERWLPMDIATTRVPAARIPLRAVGMLVLIGLLIAGAVAAFIGAQPRLPAPFGLAANGLIAVSVDGDIHMLHPVSGAWSAIVVGPEVDSAPAVSPDGRHIAFQRQYLVDGRTMFDLVTVRADGSESAVITGEPLIGGFDAFAWAPDSRSLLVDHAKDDDVWLYDASGAATPRAIASNAQVYPAPFRPPDGSAVLLYRDLGSTKQMLRLDLETSRETILAEGRTNEDMSDARWAPDGSAVVYSGVPTDDTRSVRLFTAKADGTGSRQITDAPGVWWDIDATWAPSGDRIAFDRYESVGGEWLVRQLAIYDVATGAVRDVGPLPRETREQRPSDGDAGASYGEGFWFEWSPDGTSLLAIPGEGPAHPVLIDPATGDWRILDPIVAPDFVTEAWQRVAP
jgi:hypothetical protein